MTINVKYFASLREESGISNESIDENYQNPLELFEELSKKYNFSLTHEQVKVSVNGAYQNWDFNLNDQDLVVFIPPVAGG